MAHRHVHDPSLCFRNGKTAGAERARRRLTCKGHGSFRNAMSPCSTLSCYMCVRIGSRRAPCIRVTVKYMPGSRRFLNFRPSAAFHPVASEILEKCRGTSAQNTRKRDTAMVRAGPHAKAMRSICSNRVFTWCNPKREFARGSLITSDMRRITRMNEAKTRPVTKKSTCER
jgi:hypothetical protein